MLVRFKKIIADEEKINRRVNELGREISARYGQNVSPDRPLAVIGVLDGAFVFMADLMRRISFLPVVTDFIKASSYGNGVESSGIVRITKDIAGDIRGRHVLLVEDIVDSGLTIEAIRDFLESRDPLSLTVCAMVNRVRMNRAKRLVDYAGFEVDTDDFLVGYGLDHAGFCRGLPAIYSIEV